MQRSNHQDFGWLFIGNYTGKFTAFTVYFTSYQQQLFSSKFFFWNIQLSLAKGYFPNCYTIERLLKLFNQDLLLLHTSSHHEGFGPNKHSSVGPHVCQIYGLGLDHPIIVYFLKCGFTTQHLMSLHVLPYSDFIKDYNGFLKSPHAAQISLLAQYNICKILKDNPPRNNDLLVNVMARDLIIVETAQKPSPTAQNAKQNNILTEHYIFIRL